MKYIIKVYRVPFLLSFIILFLLLSVIFFNHNFSLSKYLISTFNSLSLVYESIRGLNSGNEGSIFIDIPFLFTVFSFLLFLLFYSLFGMINFILKKFTNSPIFGKVVQINIFYFIIFFPIGISTILFFFFLFWSASSEGL